LDHFGTFWTKKEKKDLLVQNHPKHPQKIQKENLINIFLGIFWIILGLFGLKKKRKIYWSKITQNTPKNPKRKFNKYIFMNFFGSFWDFLD